ncbi:hypothetical protein QVD17_30872 [Tagetes erecta]|uniref:Uncharacterized protein n=1 Tax=Tagetes erecta TaxID=13708 RepID=A0AAD8K543_TARER|nr:hypothetical protein QVD17_30872 [Tagetes erecta]
MMVKTTATMVAGVAAETSGSLRCLVIASCMMKKTKTMCRGAWGVLILLLFDFEEDEDDVRASYVMKKTKTMCACLL